MSKLSDAEFAVCYFTDAERERLAARGVRVVERAAGGITSRFVVETSNARSVMSAGDLLRLANRPEES